MLLDVGNVGYQVGAVGIVAFTLAYLATVRWWSDHLGRVIAGVTSAMSAVLAMTTLRMIYPSIINDQTYLIVRLVIFWSFGLGVWLALTSFVWAQFFAPRIRQSERGFIPRRKHEEAHLADRRHPRDGGVHDDPGGVE